ncbi:hypothetical protein, partial [Enterobacter hormaechei]|uniref:hypothetical protein n=1 Tax=Enterobacter hormaechei TaxID=158836 RepID=UPI00197A8082
ESVLAPYRERSLVRSGDDGPVALLNMIQSGRIDFTLDYDIILTYLTKTAPEQAKGLVYGVSTGSISGKKLSSLW